jgi:hypothetical protein
MLHDETLRLPGPDDFPVPDPAQVQRELHAFLVNRGRQVAMDAGMDLDHTQAQYHALGRLDVLGQYPGVNPDLALILEMVAPNLEQGPGPAPETRYRSGPRERL